MPDIASDERVARFLTDDGHFVESKGRVKPRAFWPARIDNTTSVFRRQGLSEDGIWSLAIDHVEPTRGPVLARAELIAQDVVACGLQLEADDDPPRHAAITGWPAKDTEKEKVKSLCQELADRATLVIRPA